MIDRTLMFNVLTVLREQRDLSCGTDENQLFNEINLRATQPVTTALLREHIALAQDKSWIEPKRDMLGARRWRITPAGCGALDDLKAGE